MTLKEWSIKYDAEVIKSNDMKRLKVVADMSRNQAYYDAFNLIDHVAIDTSNGFIFLEKRIMEA